MQVCVGIFVLVWRFRDFSFLFHILETEGRWLMRGLALNQFVLDGIATLDWRGIIEEKTAKKIAVVMGRRKQQKRRRSHFSLFSSSSILLNISLPPIVSCCIILSLSPGFNFFLYFLLLFFLFFSFLWGTNM
ncbi:hypothetical protein B9Z19DRAFT_660373 [Tuber borchii]|uniref:Uncharacterized protein n=1 Tax=Tuber borchii TaxID=42251 RepID=A0A2T6ZAN8_TUBBO|nr:hypothetical protein B9Z19DRAFT_660373 [Tuber borchii]